MLSRASTYALELSGSPQREPGLRSYPSIGSLEVEVRLGRFNRCRFVPGVPKRIFEAYKRRLLDSGGEFREENTTDYYIEGERYTVHENGEVYLTTKSMKRNFDDRDLDIRASVAIEDNVPKSLPNKVSGGREKHRLIFPNPGYEIHLTEVSTEGQVTFEVEIEFEDGGDERFMASVTGEVLRDIRETDILYTSWEKRKILSMINRALGSREDRWLSYREVPRPRGMKLEDVFNITSGCSGGRKIGYFASPKADGVSEFMVASKWGIYLVSIIGRINKISSMNFPDNIIVHGESVPKDNLNVDASNPYTLFVFDMISQRGRDTSILPYRDRMRQLRNVENILAKIPGITVKVKQTFEVTDGRSFFLANKAILEGRYPFKTDGIVFTPNTSYKKGDILKWKPPRELTIDLILNEEGRLYASRGYEFIGSEEFPVNRVISNMVLEESNPEDILEFRYAGGGKLEATRVRDDKPSPNLLSTAEGVWYEIHHPISEQFMIGRELDLFRLFLSDKKRELFDEACRNLPRHTSRLLIIGDDVLGTSSYDFSNFGEIVRISPTGGRSGEEKVIVATPTEHELIARELDDDVKFDMVLVDTSLGAIPERIDARDLLRYKKRDGGRMLIIDFDPAKVRKIIRKMARDSGEQGSGYFSRDILRARITSADTFSLYVPLLGLKPSIHMKMHNIWRIYNKLHKIRGISIINRFSGIDCTSVNPSGRTILNMLSSFSVS